MATRTTGRPGALAEWARCLGFLGVGRSSIWLLIGLCFTSFRPWGMHAFFMVLTCGIAAATRPFVVAPQLSYLQSLPVRASSRALLALPQIAIAALLLAIGARWHHDAPAKTLTLWGCCAWAISASYFLKTGRRRDVLLWFVTVGAAPIVSVIAYGPESSDPSWTRAAIASLSMAALGLALSPRSSRRPPTRPTTQSVPETRSAAPPFRPSNAVVGLGRLFGFGASQPGWFTWLLPIGNLILALVFLGTGVDVTAFSSWLVMTTVMIPAVSAANSRRNHDFLGSRPLRRRRILASTVLPWFLCALLFPLTALLQEVASHARSHEPSARMALTALSVLFLGGVEAPRFDTFAHRAETIVRTLGPFALLCVTMASTPTIRVLPAPPLWSIATLAVVSAFSWYRRLPWRRLSITS